MILKQFAHSSCCPVYRTIIWGEYYNGWPSFPHCLIRMYISSHGATWWWVNSLWAMKLWSCDHSQRYKKAAKKQNSKCHIVDTLWGFFGSSPWSPVNIFSQLLFWTETVKPIPISSDRVNNLWSIIYVFEMSRVLTRNDYKI